MVSSLSGKTFLSLALMVVFTQATSFGFPSQDQNFLTATLNVALVHFYRTASQSNLKPDNIVPTSFIKGLPP